MWLLACIRVMAKTLASGRGFSRSRHLTASFSFTRQTDPVGYASKRVFLKFIDFELHELYCASYLCRGIGQTSCSFEHVSCITTIFYTFLKIILTTPTHVFMFQYVFKVKRQKQDKNINLTLPIHTGKDRFRNWAKRELTDKQELQNQSTNNIGLIFQLFQSNGKCFSFLSTTNNMGLIFP